MARYTDGQFKAAFYLSSAVAVLGGVWLNIEPAICPVPATLLDKGNGQPPCFEFWLYRYQTLLTGIGAIFAAWLASLPVRSQLREMARQSAALSRQFAIDAAVALEKEQVALEDAAQWDSIIYRLFAHYDEEPFKKIYSDWPKWYAEVRKELTGLLDQQDIRSARDTDLSPVGGHRKAANLALDSLISRLDDLRYALREQTSGPNYEEGEVDLSVEERKETRKAASDALTAWTTRRNALLFQILGTIPDAWTRVRELERAAGAQ